jgi:hypothetical protein
VAIASHKPLKVFLLYQEFFNFLKKIPSDPGQLLAGMKGSCPPDRSMILGDAYGPDMESTSVRDLGFWPHDQLGYELMAQKVFLPRNLTLQVA